MTNPTTPAFEVKRDEAATEFIQNHDCQYLQFNNTTDEIVKLVDEAHKAGSDFGYAEAVKGMSVSGEFLSIYAPHISYEGHEDIRELNRSSPVKPVDQEFTEFIEIGALQSLNARLALAEKREAELIKALEFYADPDNFHVDALHIEEIDQEDFQIIADVNGVETDDFSKVARKALNPTSQHKEKA